MALRERGQGHRAHAGAGQVGLGLGRRGLGRRAGRGARLDAVGAAATASSAISPGAVARADDRPTSTSVSEGGDGHRELGAARAQEAPPGPGRAAPARSSGTATRWWWIPMATMIGTAATLARGRRP